MRHRYAASGAFAVEKIAFSIAEVAKLTGVHENTVKNWERRGEIKTVRLGARILVPRHELERLGLLPKQNPAMQGGER